MLEQTDREPHKAWYAPANPCVFLADPDGGTVPTPVEDKQFQMTSTCIMLACMSDVEDGTDFTLGNAAELDVSSAPAFEACLDVPMRVVVLSAVDGTHILEMPWPDKRVRVQISTNRPKWPDKVTIGLSRA